MSCLIGSPSLKLELSFFRDAPTTCTLFSLSLSPLSSSLPIQMDLYSSHYCDMIFLYHLEYGDDEPFKDLTQSLM